ncbi:MAG TPA: hypothetical protein GX747_00160 [Tenericutes bacterium]|nr:hypothetical protein [Mycoplasmatota bacterium]
MELELRNENSKIFIISGKARQGKDIVAGYMKKYYEESGLKVILLSYGEYIKNYAKKIVDWDGSDETKPRTLLQMLGTDLIRNKIDKHLFIKRMIEDIKIYTYFFDIIIITDARLVDEIEIIKSNFTDAISINLTRPNFESELNSKEVKHITEIGLDGYDKYDIKITNDSTLEKLEEKVRKVLGDLNEN